MASAASQEAPAREGPVPDDEVLTPTPQILAMEILKGTGSLLTSVASSIYQYRQENGLTYHAYKDGGEFKWYTSPIGDEQLISTEYKEYPYPNNEQELDRLDLQHNLFSLTLDSKLYTAPISKNPQEVLDIGTGTGIWAMEFADKFPSAFNSVPPNLTFEIDDSNDEWTYHRNFDYIHCRQLHCAVEEHHLFDQAFKALKPGGWIEMQEAAFPLACDDSSFPETSALRRWGNLMVEASTALHQELDKPSKYEDWIRQKGFANVRGTLYKWPTNQWPKDPVEKQKGLWTLANITQGLYANTVGLFTRGLGWNREEVEVFLVDVRKQLQDRKIHAYFPIYVVYGQKPLEAGTEAATE
ncbi:MAG: hypothetical protein M1834_003009 [Cirrosporium novae-zelandiae]|nr:MAG: hypothetical protein M1834_003009 [Cirrosporium novae-zelandiae]